MFEDCIRLSGNPVRSLRSAGRTSFVVKEEGLCLLLDLESSYCESNDKAHSSASILQQSCVTKSVTAASTKSQRCSESEAMRVLTFSTLFRSTAFGFLALIFQAPTSICLLHVSRPHPLSSYLSMCSSMKLTMDDVVAVLFSD